MSADILKELGYCSSQISSSEHGAATSLPLNFTVTESRVRWQDR